MFTFVVWAVGIYIIAKITLVVIAVLFEIFE